VSGTDQADLGGPATGAEVRRIRVGVDGSDGSLDALRWAASERALRDARLRVLLAWHMPAFGPVPPMPVDEESWQRGAERTLRESLTAVFGPEPPSKVQAEVRNGRPAPTLLAAAGEADLLVVGSRGHGGMAGLLLGSVSTACVHHAPCPVLVVRPAHRRRDGG
jgi:nucleotide-binding universal stress UspA family protein